MHSESLRVGPADSCRGRMGSAHGVGSPHAMAE
jgi:hypothetical protein